MSDSGLSAFGFCPTCGRGGQVRAVWREAVHAVHRLRREADLRGKLFLGLRPVVWGPVRMEAGDLARSVEQGDGAVPVFEHPDGALGEMMPVAVGRNL